MLTEMVSVALSIYRIKFATPGIESFGFQIVYKDLLTHENVTVGNATVLYSF